MANPPILIEPIPALRGLEGTVFPALDLNDYIVAANEADGDINFFAELLTGKPIPQGLLCSPNGIISGIPSLGSHGNYTVQIKAKNNAENPLITEFNLLILEKIAEKPGLPILVKVIPNFVINEGAALGPIDLKEYVRPFDPENEKLHFTAEVAGGASLPQGIICTSTGILSGIPAANTRGNFDINLLVENIESHSQLETTFHLVIKERIGLGGESQFYTGLKSQVWDALGKNQPITEFEELFKHQLTAVEIYYLMQRFATLTIFDVYNLDPPGKPILLNLPGASPHYNIYDRGSCIVGTPKELFSHERTLEDALVTAKVMAREVHKRGWTLELVGFQKMMRATWVEMQVLGKKTGNYLDVLHYTPTNYDQRLYEAELQSGMSLGKNL